jgi:hypothetical protein
MEMSFFCSSNIRTSRSKIMRRITKCQRIWSNFGSSLPLTSKKILLPMFKWFHIHGFYFLLFTWISCLCYRSKMMFRNAPWMPAQLNDKGSFQLLKFTNSESGFVDIPDTLLKRMKFWTTLTHEYLAPFDQI